MVRGPDELTPRLVVRGPDELAPEKLVVRGPRGRASVSVLDCLVLNGGLRNFASWIKLSYCSAVAVNVAPSVAGLSSFAVSHAAWKVCFAQLSFGLPTRFAAGYSGFSLLKVICVIGSSSGNLMMCPRSATARRLIVVEKVSSC